MVERLPVKEMVVGSSPTSGAESWCGVYAASPCLPRSEPCSTIGVCEGFNSGAKGVSSIFTAAAHLLHVYTGAVNVSIT